MAVVFVGNHPTCDAGWAKCPTPSDGKEAIDRKAINLEQEEFVKQIYAANPKTVVVLLASFPIAINWSQENVPAILHMTHNARRRAPPSPTCCSATTIRAAGWCRPGRSRSTRCPPMMDYDIRHGRTYMYFKGEPLYPFGYRPQLHHVQVLAI